MMTLDEAIKHCQEKSCDNTECAKDHKQLGEWLTELKEYRNLSLKDFENELQKEINSEWLKCLPVDEGMGLESANIVNEQFEHIVRHFVEWTKKKIMYEAIEGRSYSTFNGEPTITAKLPENNQWGIKFGDKVKFIIIKED